MGAGEVTRRPPFGDNPTVGERGATTQRRILEAALEIFAEHGYHEARVELITEAAGCSRPAFYQYFSSKEDLFWRLAGHMARAMGDLADRIPPTTPDAAGVDVVRAWLEDLIDLTIEYVPIMTGFQAAVRDQSPGAATFRQIDGHLGGAIIESADPPDPGLAVGAAGNALVAVTLRAIQYWRIGIGGLSRTRFATGTAQSIHRLLHGCIEGVNATKVVKAPPRRRPKWPDFPGAASDDVPLRPRGQQTRETLLDAGRRVLPRRGYHDTRVDDIVEEAEVSHGSFYRYFGNKNELFQVLAEQAATQLVDLVSSFPDDLTETAIQEWVRTWFRSYEANGGIISAWQELDHDDPALDQFSIEVALVVFDRLTRIVHRRGFGDPTVDALLLLSVIERIPYSVLAIDLLDREDAIEASALIILRGLFGTRP